MSKPESVQELACANLESMETLAEPLRQAARADAAWQATALALASWANTSNYAQMQVDAALGPSCQARWYAKAQANLHCWIKNGGFAQE